MNFPAISTKSRIAGIAFVSMQTVFLAAVVIAAPRWPGHWPAAWSVCLGSIAFLYAAWTGLGGVYRLGRNRTPLPMPKPDSRLITVGIYGIIRHPLYASMMAMGLGWSCFWSSITALWITVGLIIFLHGKALYEERLLRAKFTGYASYECLVPRYFPGLWSVRR